MCQSITSSQGIFHNAGVQQVISTLNLAVKKATTPSQAWILAALGNAPHKAADVGSRGDRVSCQRSYGRAELRPQKTGWQSALTRRLCVSLGDQLANERDQLSAVLLSVIERLVASDEKTAGTELVVGQECLGNRIGRSNKCS